VREEGRKARSGLGREMGCADRRREEKKEVGQAESRLGKKERLSIFLKRFKHLQFKFKYEDSNLN